MAENMIDLNGLVHVWSKVKTLTNGCVKASDLATVATSGSYNDLTDKPTIPASATVDSELSSTSVNPVQNKVINAALNSKADSSALSAYLPLAGGACTGSVSAPNFQTGTGANNYFQCRKFRGEGDADTYYHAVDFGYSGHDSVDFYEYDPNWNFYKCTSGQKSSAVLVGNINENGWNGGARLSGTPTAPTATAGTNTTQIATTAFVQTAVSGKVSASSLAAVATSGNYNDLTNRPSIPVAYTLPYATGDVLGGVKIGSNISASYGTISLTKANVTSALGYTPPMSDTTYGNATSSAAGLMSSTDKSKLDSIANYANNYVHPASHPAAMITGLANVAKTGSYNDLSDRPTIPAAIIVDDTLAADSTNAIQNKAVYGLGQKFFNQLSALAAVARSGSYNDLTDKPGNATTSSAGFMSAADKAKLDKVDADAGSVKLITYS